MSTKREGILVAVKTALESITLVGGRVYRSRISSFTRAETPAVLFYPISDSPDETSYPKITWTILIRVAVLARGDEPDSLADPIIKSVHDKIINDSTLKGLSISIDPDAVTFDLLDADKPAIVVNNDFRIRYQTSFTDLSAAI